MELVGEQRVIFDSVSDMLDYQKSVLKMFKKQNKLKIEINIPIFIDKPTITILLYRNVTPNELWIKERQLSLN